MRSQFVTIAMRQAEPAISIGSLYAAGRIWPIQYDAKKLKKITETLTHGYASESTRRKLFDAYQHDRV